MTPATKLIEAACDFAKVVDSGCDKHAIGRACAAFYSTAHKLMLEVENAAFDRAAELAGSYSMGTVRIEGGAFEWSPSNQTIAEAIKTLKSTET